MRSHMATLLRLFFFMLVLSSVPAARALEIYGGAEGTATTFSGACNGATSNPSFSGSCDDTGTGWKAFAGLQLIPLTAVEVGYIDFGKAQASGALGGSAASPELSANASYLAFVLRATLFDRLTVYGKAGGDYWRATGNLGTALGTSQNATGTSYMYGVGASFKIVGPLGVIAEAERYQNVGDQSTTGQANINAFSLGLVLRF
ncbi:MAG TPA: outer membrane beta-barrel protein [Burkholderiales bacterium]|nr:outer membrane beta-barrel protein [Burkholderiales bacterium]